MLEILIAIIAFVIVIGVIVTIHELGHFWVARQFRVKVEIFSLGMGKPLYSWYDRYGTKWQLALWPIGGFVKMFGDANPASAPDTENLAKMTPQERDESFFFKPRWQKFLVVLAGPVANFLLAIILFTGLFVGYGRVEFVPKVTSIVEDSAAASAGVKEGDIIKYFNGKAVHKFGDIVLPMNLNQGEAIELQLERDGVMQTLQVNPKPQVITDDYGNEQQIYRLGLVAGEATLKKFGLMQGIVVAVEECYELSVMMVKAIGQIVTGDRSTKEIGSVLQIADYSGKSMTQGFAAMISFIALISLNLGLINLVPIPLLDGGHLMFYIFEWLNLGRHLPQKFYQLSYSFGYAFVVGLMLLALFNDAGRYGLI